MDIKFKKSGIFPTFLWIVVISLFGLICFYFYMLHQENLYYAELKTKILEIQPKVEEYKNKYGKYPHDINELGYNYDESGPIFYNNYGDYYCITYAIGFDENPGYCSSIHGWKDY